jgi:hypothetical protein
MFNFFNPCLNIDTENKETKKLIHKRKLIKITKLDENESATLIQQRFRAYIQGRETRKKFKIIHLKEEKLTKEATFVIGNDPLIKNLKNYESEETTLKTAYITCSGVRIISTALRFEKNNKVTPKIILIDNSIKVYKFWYALREFMSQDKYAKTLEIFKKNFPWFLKKHEDLYKNLDVNALEIYATKERQYLRQDILSYFTELSKLYGYNKIRQIIKHASLIKQSWADRDVFIKIKNIVNYLGINKVVMYPSNILSCMPHDKTREQMLENIYTFLPNLTIHTDLCIKHKVPENTFLLTDNNPEFVKNTIFAQNDGITNYFMPLLKKLSKPQNPKFYKFIQTISHDNIAFNKDYYEKVLNDNQDIIKNILCN